MKKAIYGLSLTLLLSGCGPLWTYVPNPPLAGVQPKNIRVAVTPFEHWLPEDQTGSDINILPGVFFTREVLYVGSTFADWTYWSPEKTYEECLAKELSASNLFASVDYMDWDELSESYYKYDLIVTGNFYYDRRKGSYFGTYGLSMAGAIISNLLFLPNGVTHRDLKFDVQVLLPSSPNSPVWEQGIHVQDPKSIVSLGFIGDNDELTDRTPKLLANAFLEVRNSIAKELESNGKIYVALFRAGK